MRRRMAAAAARAGRDAAEIRLLAISKTKPVAAVQLAVDAGITELGENKVQEAERKIPRIDGDVRWHLVGSLQSNKTRRAAQLFDAIHSVDRLKLVRRLDAGAAESGRRLEVYVQVEFTRDERSDEQVERDTWAVAAETARAPNLELAGLMTLPPFEPDPEAARPWFRRLRDMRDRLRADGIEAPGLSMGMSNDFEVAIEEGATIVRVGTTIFGARE